MTKSSPRPCPCGRASPRGWPPGRTTTVGRRAVRVQVRPTSGISADRDKIGTAVDAELAAYALDRPLAPSVHISREGALGQ